MGEPRIAVGLAADENYFPLARDLVLSLFANVLPTHPVEIVCLDIGLAPQSRNWMVANGVSVRNGSVDRLDPALRPLVAARPYMLAQYSRPFWPELAPNAEIILHIDCDAWLQNAGVIDACAAAIAAFPETMVLAPSASHYGGGFYEDIQAIVEMQANWVFGCYEKAIADRLSRMAFFSSGVFAAHRNAQVWRRWEGEIARMAPLIATINPGVLHLAEQTALNGVVRMHGTVTVLDPIYNFHCNAGGVRRDAATGKVVTSLVHPNREVGVVHLADWRARQADYAAEGLLFRPTAAAR
jgi:hypothetical protein